MGLNSQVPIMQVYSPAIHFNFMNFFNLFKRNTSTNKQRKARSIGGGPLPPLNNDTLREVVLLLAKRDVTMPIEYQMSDAQFASVRQAVDEVVKYFRPSGYNKTHSAMSAGITTTLAGLGLTEEQYWAECWRRGGRRSCCDYNKTVILTYQPNTNETVQAPSRKVEEKNASHHG